MKCIWGGMAYCDPGHGPLERLPKMFIVRNPLIRPIKGVDLTKVEGFYYNYTIRRDLKKKRKK